MICLRSVIAVAAAATFLPPAAAAAAAATVLETSEQKIAQSARFDGVGCERPAEQIVVLPKRSKAITPESPLAGTQLYGPGSGEPIAVVKRVYYAPGIITWEVVGTGASCASPAPWQTGVLTLRATVTVERRVLTRKTVIERGDRICAAGFARVTPLMKGLYLASFADQTARFGRIAQHLRAMHRRLGALAIPSERRSRFRSFRNRIDDVQLAADDAAAAASRRDKNALDEAIGDMFEAMSKAVTAARRYGFRGSCAA